MKHILYPFLGLFAILLVGSATNGNAQTNLTDPLPKDNKVKIGKLDNGLTYFIRENKKPEQKVELRLVINAGSILEDDDQQGLAHMAEHMAFNGTKNFKENEIISYLQSIGVGFGNDLNAYTSFNETVYMLPIPTDKPGNVEKGFQILEDWAHQVSYLDKDINEERNVILEESRLGQGAQERMRRKWLPMLFEGSMYAERLPIGVDSIIQHFEPDAIRRFYRDWYRPNLMAVIVVGDIDPNTAEDLIKKHFAGIKNPANPRPRDIAPLPAYKKSNAIVVTDKEATNYSISVYYSALPSTQSTTLGDYKQDIVKQLFAALVNQRLRELTQKENPPFLAAGMGFSDLARGYEQPYLSVVAGDKDSKQALEAALEEVEKVKRFGFTAPELERIKKSVLASVERQYNERDKSESENFVEEYIRHFLEGVAIPGIENEFKYYQQLIPQIKLDDLNAIAKQLAKESDHFFAMLMGPEPDATTKLPTAQDLIASAAAVAKKDIKPYEEKMISSTLVSKMPKAGKVIKETKNATWGTTVWELSNGVKVSIKKTEFKNDQILMGARRSGGTGGYGLEDKFNVNYATGVAEAMGIGDFSPTDLQKSLAGKTANARVILSGTFDGFSGSSSVKDLETMMQLLYLRATSPRKDTGLFNAFVQRSKAQMTFAMANPQTAFVDSLIKALYDNNPLGPIAVPKAEYFDKINVDRALAIYNERFGDVTGFEFVFVGAIDEAVLKPLVETYIASLPASGKKFAWKDQGVRLAKGQKQLDFYKGQAKQSLILSFHSGEVPYSEDLELKANAISEILNIRIIEELREKIQGIYSGGTSASVEKIPYNNFQIVFQLPCGPEKIDTLLLAMNAEIEELKKNGPSEDVLNKVKQQWIETYKTSLQENGTWLNRILKDKFPGGDADRFLNYEKYVNSLTPAQIKVAANMLLSGKNVFTAILRPEPKKEESTSGQ
jgi:zinc protease